MSKRCFGIREHDYYITSQSIRCSVSPMTHFPDYCFSKNNLVDCFNWCSSLPQFERECQKKVRALPINPLL